MSLNFSIHKITQHLKSYSRLVYNKQISFQKYITEKPQMHRYIFIMVLFCIFCVLLWFNIKTPLIGDDFVYSFIYQTPKRLTCLKDIFYSQYLHYFQWGGRSIVHFIAQALLLIKNPLIVDTLEALIFTTYIYIMYKHIIGHKHSSISILAITFMCVWLLLPTFAETTLWLTGSANYLWGTLLILLFLLPYRLFRNQHINKTKSICYAIGMLLFGIIAGWTNENTAAGMIVIIVSFMLTFNYKKWKIPAWCYFGLIGACLGYILMIIAPGNFARAEGTSISPFLIIYRTLMASQKFVGYLGILNLGLIVISILYYRFARSNPFKILTLSAIYIIGTLISVYIMTASPGFPPRTWFGPITFNIIAFGIVLYNLNYNLPFLRDIKNSILLFCFISVCFSLYDAYNDVNEIDKIWKSRMSTLKQQKELGAKRVIFKEYQAKTKFGLGDAPYAKKYISDYYGIDFELE